MPKRVYETLFQLKVIRRYQSIAAFAVFSLLLGTVLVLSLVRPEIHRESEVPYVATSTPEVSIVATSTTAQPTTLRIPSVDIEAPFSAPLGVQPNLEIAVPNDFISVGYYKYGPIPGDMGPAVVLGHVDSVAGPAIFYRLDQVSIGDEVFIDREDGSRAIFTIDSIERHEQSGFPTDKVYGRLDYAGLRLITCSGVYDKGLRRYSHNLIVFARLQEIVTPSVDAVVPN